MRQHSARRIWKVCGCNEWAWRGDGNTHRLGTEVMETKSWPMIWSTHFRGNLGAPHEVHIAGEGTAGLAQGHLAEGTLLLS